MAWLTDWLARGALLLAISSGLVACDVLFHDGPRGFRPTVRLGGPRVLFDLDAQPLPEIPFPNDLATRPDPTSPTGRRVNLSLIGPTLLEQTVRAKADRLDGFGLFAPITVRFDAAIDVEKLRARHLNDLVIDDAIYVINVDPESEEFGERVWLDIGHYAERPDEMRGPDDPPSPRSGRFPSVLDRPDKYFEHDPRGAASTLLFETVLEEDLNGNGVADPDEDTDADGVLDRPNTADGEPRVPGSVAEADALIPFFEFETNTLMIRTVVPLREATTYAVVLSRYVVDRRGRPIESPFDYVNHTRQTEALAPLNDLLPRYGLDPDDVTFAWTFTTQSATRELEMVRRGLYGHGPLAWLEQDFPAELAELWPWSTEATIETCVAKATSDEARVACQPPVSHVALDAKAFVETLRIVAPVVMQTGEDTDALLDSYRFVDYLVAGRFVTPYFLVDRDGLAEPGWPQDDDESFEIDLETGDAIVGPEMVTFWCAIPKSLEYTDLDGRAQRHTAPFPTVLYGHSYGGARFEMLGFAGHHARFGLATCSVDAMGHGMTIPPDILRVAEQFIPPLLANAGIDGAMALNNVLQGRQRDLNNDGVPDSGGDFWTADTFHTRDMVRQTAVDWLQLVRLLRSFDGVRTSAIDLDGDDQLDDLAGDFNGDGVPDLGGPDNDFFSWGQSLGGILSVLAPAVEPALVAAAPTAGGAGLIDIGIRSRNPGVPEAVVLRMMGPLILADPVTDDAGNATDRYSLRWLVPNTSPPGGTPREESVPIGEYGFEEGDIVVMRNLTREANSALPPPDRRFAVVRAGQGFRAGHAADAWSATEKRARLGFDPSAEDFEPHRMTEAEVLASGDRFVLEVYRPGSLGHPRKVIDTWQQDVEWQGTIYPADSPLVAPAEGLGHQRQTPDLRRFFGIAQSILAAGDPAAYARRYFVDPIDMTDIEPNRRSETRVLVIPTAGDQMVPINTGLNLARALGVTDYRKRRRDLYGLTEDDLLLATGVYEGTTRVPRWIDDRGPYNFDPDDLDEGTDGLATDGRGNFRLRLTKTTPDGGIAAMRMPYLARSNNDSDTHGFDASTPSRAFDINTFAANQVSLFFMMRGQDLTAEQLDARCLEFLGGREESCPFAPRFPE